MKMRTTVAALAALALLTAALAVYAQTTGQPTGTATTTTTAAPTPEERVAAIKTNLVTSQKNIKMYTWIETTTVSYKGEVKSTKVATCAYGADGKVVKTEAPDAAAGDSKRGLRKKIVDDKKADMTAYVESAVALVKGYVPPDPAKIQACKEAGNMTMTPVDPGKKARLDFKDYEKSCAANGSWRCFSAPRRPRRPPAFRPWKRRARPMPVVC
jgi:hypothetical protein